MLAVADRTFAPAGTHDAYLHLRALTVVGRWAPLAAADLVGGRYVLALDRAWANRRLNAGRAWHHRTLLLGEPFWWSAGLTDALDGAGGQVLGLIDEPVPELLTLVEAAALLPSVWDRSGTPRADQMTDRGVEYLINSGELVAVGAVPDSPGRVKRERHVFGAQVRALAAARRAEAAGRSGVGSEAQRAQAAAESPLRAWQELLVLLPPVRAPWRATYEVLPSPSLLPVTGRGPKQRQRALLIGEQLGLFRYVHPTDDGGYVLEVAGVERVLPAHGVLPYVLGAADATGRGALVAWRDGLG